MTDAKGHAADRRHRRGCIETIFTSSLQGKDGGEGRGKGTANEDPFPSRPAGGGLALLATGQGAELLAVGDKIEH